jgi:hypothetical protein
MKPIEPGCRAITIGLEDAASNGLEVQCIRLRNAAFDGPGGERIVEMAWAEHLGPNVKVMGIPTGVPGTGALMDLNGMLQGAFKGVQ